MTPRMPSSPAVLTSSQGAVHGDETRSTAGLLAFFALAFVWSWACWLLAPVLKVGSPVAATTLSLAGGFGPSLAAVVVVAHGSGVTGLRRWLTRCLRWRAGWSSASDRPTRW